MLADVHSAIQRLVYEHGGIPAHDVDVRFDPPRRDWVNSLLRPTLDFFLFDIQENTDLRHTSLESTRGNGRAVYRVPPRRFDLRYMVSVLTTVPEDEHLLLWRALATLVKYADLPPAVLGGPLREWDPPIVTQVKQPDEEGTLLDLWSALESPPRPALLYVVTVPLDLEIALESPLVLTRTVRYHRQLGVGAEAETRLHVGGALRDRRGVPLAGAAVTLEGRGADGVITDAAGQFVLANVPAGAATLRVSREGRPTRTVKIQVPLESYEIVVD